ncbi:MAG: hypothetical protein QGI60_03830, partial [archaeon]|nr:hypothetical protein [archaeon]
MTKPLLNVDSRPLPLLLLLLLAGFVFFTLFASAPFWITAQSAQESDANGGTAVDFNFTKVTWDGNIMPSGGLRIPDVNLPSGGLVGYWSFDDGNTLIDKSGNGNTGIYLGGADNNAYGKWDTNAGFFDGANDF